MTPIKAGDSGILCRPLWGDQQSLFYVFAPLFARIAQRTNFDARIIRAIARAASAMPEWELSRDDAAEVTVYIKSLRK
jgi:hypothetical protein